MNSNSIKKIFAVRGMTCTGCEATIERILNRIDGVKSAKADFTSNRVMVEYADQPELSDKIKTALHNAGYDIDDMQPSEYNSKQKSVIFSFWQFIGIAVIIVGVLFAIERTIGFNFIPEVTSGMGYGMLFVAGLLTSLHCVAMCGGINISQCVAGGKAGDSAIAKLRPSLLYNGGRVVSYTLVGAVAGIIGTAVSFTGWARGIVAVVSGIFMVIMGLSMLGLPWFNRLIPRLPKALRRKTGQAGRGRGPFIVGLLNGLMPCGPLQAMQLYALGTGSFLAGAASMFFFGLGTVPLMLGLGALSAVLGSRFTGVMMKVGAALVIALGIIMASRGLALSGISFLH